METYYYIYLRDHILFQAHNECHIPSLWQANEAKQDASPPVTVPVFGEPV